MIFGSVKERVKLNSVYSPKKKLCLTIAAVC